MNSQQIEALESAIHRDWGNLTGIIAEQNGTVLYEGYFHGYTGRDACHVYSVTKSVVSALIGIATAEGAIQSLDQRVLDFFPEYRPQPDNRTIRDVTLRHLLTMTAPYRCAEEPYQAFFSSENWVEFALDLLGGDQPPGTFRYAPIAGPHILSGILARATGRPILDYAGEHLFSPLGIRLTDNIVLHDQAEHIAVMNTRRSPGWVVDPQGLNTASWGLFLTPADMVKLGSLYRKGGLWEGRQVLPARWVRESTAVQSQWGGLSYGWLWWVMDEKKRVYAALGDGGNAIYVNESKGLVVAMAARLGPEGQDPVAFITEHIEPLIEGQG